VIGRIGAHTQVAFLQSTRSTQQMLRLGLQAEQAARENQQFLAQRRGGDPPAAAVEQFHAIGFLQRLDLAGKRRLGHMQGIGRLGKTALAGHRVEGAELAVVH